nr:MAG TPA_asm: hypothetical protein [Caudoviricetes sp.]
MGCSIMLLPTPLLFLGFSRNPTTLIFLIVSQQLRLPFLNNLQFLQLLFCIILKSWCQLYMSPYFINRGQNQSGP